MSGRSVLFSSEAPANPDGTSSEFSADRRVSFSRLAARSSSSTLFFGKSCGGLGEGSVVLDIACRGERCVEEWVAASKMTMGRFRDLNRFPLNTFLVASSSLCDAPLSLCIRTDGVPPYETSSPLLSYTFLMQPTLKHFILRHQVLALYRSAIRAARRVSSSNVVLQYKLLK